MDQMFSLPLNIIWDMNKCTACGVCAKMCTTYKITAGNDGKPIIINSALCISCGHCIAACPEGCLSADNKNGFFQPNDTCPYRKGIDSEMLSKYMMSRRSVRTWKNKTVSRDDITKLINIAAYAPSACNVHPVKWVVITDQQKIRDFTDASVAYLKTIPKDHPNAMIAKMILNCVAEGDDPICRNAPALIIATSNNKDESFLLIDSIIALSAIDTYAPSIGLGTCWVGYVMMMLQLNPDLKKILEIPNDWIPQYAMLIGYPSIKFSQIPPREIPEVKWV